MLELAARPPPLITSRLVLRELRLSDAVAVARHAGDRRVSRFLLGVPTPYPTSLAARWIATRIAWWSAGRGVTLAVARRASPEILLGTVSLRRFVRDRRAELGYWLAAETWGKGFATEAAGALVDCGFRELSLERIYAQVLEGNRASCRVLEKLGMTPEGTRRRHVRKGRRLYDVEMYGMLSDEWRALTRSR
jgi:ribosomal-protein-alanine N-acetyltransferase